MQVKVGIFVVPDAIDPVSTVGQILAADETGLDFVGVQDHPYQGRFFDTWTLLSYLAGRTERVRFVPDVLRWTPSKRRSRSSAASGLESAR